MAEWRGIEVMCPECGKEISVPEEEETVTPPPPPPPAVPVRKKVLTEAEEKILIARVAAMRDASGIDDYPAWGKGGRSVLFTAVPCVIVLLIMLTTGVAGRVVLISAEVFLLILSGIWVFSTFRVKKEK